MRDQRASPKGFSAEAELEELEHLLRQKKYRLSPKRRRRLKAMGRQVEVPGLEPPGSTPAAVPLRARTNGHAPSGKTQDRKTGRQQKGKWRASWRTVGDRALLLGEIVLVLFFFFAVVSLWLTNNALNRELAAAQREAGSALALPTAESGPVIDVVVLPGGHKPPVAGSTPEPGEAGYIPAHLLPAINDYEAPSAPTPGPEHARRIQIDAIAVDSAIYQGMYDWEVLKKGVAQHIGSPAPGQSGNMVLAGHNDVYGEIFRDLDQLAPGDEIRVSSERQTYTYVVRETVIVEPTEVWVMAPTEYASVTLISCYPYRVNTKRIVIFADLAT